jgi:hypothetical protein
VLQAPIAASLVTGLGQREQSLSPPQHARATRDPFTRSQLSASSTSPSGRHTARRTSIYGEVNAADLGDPIATFVERIMCGRSIWTPASYHHPLGRVNQTRPECCPSSPGQPSIADLPTPRERRSVPSPWPAQSRPETPMPRASIKTGRPLVPVPGRNQGAADMSTACRA